MHRHQYHPTDHVCNYETPFLSQAKCTHVYRVLPPCKGGNVGVVPVRGVSGPMSSIPPLPPFPLASALVDLAVPLRSCCPGPSVEQLTCMEADCLSDTWWHFPWLAPSTPPSSLGKWLPFSTARRTRGRTAAFPLLCGSSAGLDTEHTLS